MSEAVIPFYDTGMADRNLAGEAYTVDSDFQVGVVPYDYASVHQKPIVLNEHGLFDPRSLLPYITKDHCQDLVTPRAPLSCRLEYHHGLFPKKHYKRGVVPLAIKNVRNSKYNQFLMWSCQEDLYHQDSAADVPWTHLDVSSAERFVEESEALDSYAASSLSLAEAQASAEKASSSTLRIKKATLAANLALQEEINQEAEQSFQGIEVISFEVVTGALLTYFNRQPEAGLGRVIAKRLETNPIAMATRGHDEKHLRTVSRMAVDKKLAGAGFQFRKLVEVAKAA